MSDNVIRKVRLVSVALVLFLVQAAVINRFSVAWGKPALLCLLAAFLSLYAPMPDLMWGVLGLGILRDCGTGGEFGISALAVLPATAVVISLRGRFFRGGAMDVALALIFMLVFSLVEATGVILFAGVSPIWALGGIAIGQSLLSAILAFPFFFFAECVGIVGRREQATIFAN